MEHSSCRVTMNPTRWTFAARTASPLRTPSRHAQLSKTLSSTTNASSTSVRVMAVRTPQASLRSSTSNGHQRLLLHHHKPRGSGSYYASSYYASARIMPEERVLAGCDVSRVEEDCDAASRICGYHIRIGVRFRTWEGEGGWRMPPTMPKRQQDHTRTQGSTRAYYRCAVSRIVNRTTPCKHARKAGAWRW